MAGSFFESRLVGASRPNMTPPSPRTRRYDASVSDSGRLPMPLGARSKPAGLVDASAKRRRAGVMPRVWVLAAPRAGDASQVLALAEALGWPCEVKTLAFKSLSLVLAPPFSTSDAGIDRDRSSRLT